MRWIQKNFKTLIYIAFLVPILTVAFVSISHVTKWYGISNPLSWAIYLSVGIEIAALSALAAISANMGKKVYFPFGIVTLIQFIGNIYFAYQFIDVDSKAFQDWVSLVDPIVSFLGVEEGNFQSHKRFLAFFAGGLLPLISLSFLHMLVKFEEEEKRKNLKSTEKNDLEIYSNEIQENIDNIEDKTLEENHQQIKIKEKVHDIENIVREINENPLLFDPNSISEEEFEQEQVVPEEPKKRKTLTYQKRDANS